MVRKVVFDKVLKRALDGETVGIIASKSVTKKGQYLFNRGCRYFIRVVDDAYTIGIINNGVFTIQKRFTLKEYGDLVRYERLLVSLAVRFQLDDQNQHVFVRAVFDTENEYVDREQLLAMIHAHQLEEISKSTYLDRAVKMYEIYYRVEMRFLFKFCKALPDFFEFDMSGGGKTLSKSNIQLEIDIDPATCHFFQD